MEQKDLEQRLSETLAGLPREECRNCECLLGYLTQLAMDAREEERALLAPFLRPREGVHG